MYWLKGCPRCNGDLQGEEDRFGRYLACIQCGYHTQCVAAAQVSAGLQEGLCNQKRPRIRMMS